MKKLRAIGLLLVGLTLHVASAFAADRIVEKVGVYESRAVALAWGRSQQHDQMSKQLMSDFKAAEAAGNKQQMKRWKKEGSARQERLEKQVFGDQRIPDIIARIESELPTVRQQTGVTTIVDRRDAPKGAATVDVTTNLVALFQPTDKTLKMIDEIQKHKPLKSIPKH